MAGCSSVPLEKAFEGKFADAKNNRIIYNYCQSCHVHRELIPESHVLGKSELYRMVKFRGTKECRTCHYIQKNFWPGYIRKTIRPKREKFTEIERESVRF